MTLRGMLQSLRRHGTPAGLWRLARAVRDRRIIAHSPLFDREWYVQEHPDVAQAGTDPALHYLVVGHRAGLDPSPDFCGAEYAALHHLPVDANPLVHYERIGRRKSLPISFLEPGRAVAQEETESRLRGKLACGEPLTCLFLVSSASMFPARPLLDTMLRDGAFRPRIAVIPDLRWPDRDPIAPMERCEAELGEAYPGVLLPPVRPDAGGQWPDLLADFDFAVYPSPYDLSDFRYNPRWSVGRPFLGLHVNYGFYRSVYDRSLLAHQNYTHFWMAFFECAETLREYQTYGLNKGRNAVLSGYVKMDALARCQRPTSSTRKRVLLCPHHSIEGGYNNGLALSNFLRYSDWFLHLPERYPDMDFIFRPHPFLFQALAQTTFWGPRKVEEWISRFRAHANVQWSDEGDYFPVFAASDACIQDCGSYLVEYFYTGKPCCYMLKSPEDMETKFAPLGKECLQRCHLAYDTEAIDHFLKTVVRRNEDSLREPRDLFRSRLMLNYPNAATTALKAIRDRLLAIPESAQ